MAVPFSPPPPPLPDLRKSQILNFWCDLKNLKVIMFCIWYEFWIWYNHCDAGSHIRLQQAEKVRPNKQMPPERIEIIIGDPSSKCPLKESRS